MPDQRTKVLVINLHSSQNAGDAALLEMALDIISFIFPGSQITLAMNDPEEPRCYDGLSKIQVVPSFTNRVTSWSNDHIHWHINRIVSGITKSLASAFWYRITGRLPRWLPRFWYELFSSYAGADLVVSCPGNIFTTMGRFGLPFLLSAYTVAYALIMGKPLYILPQSIGPLRRGWERALVRHLYSRARLVFIREPVSFRLAQDIGLTGPKVQMVPDPAFAYPPVSPEEAGDLLRKLVGDYQRPIVGVTVINRLVRKGYEVWDRYEKAMACALSDFTSKYGGTVIFFPQVTGPAEKEDDRIAARRISAHMQNRDRVRVIEERIPPRFLKGMYGLADLFIATRMHSAIFATSMEVPTLLIEYLHKVRGLAEMLELEKWVLDLSEISESALSEKMEALWQQRIGVRNHLKSVVPVLVHQVSMIGDAIARDFYGR